MSEVKTKHLDTVRAFLVAEGIDQPSPLIHQAAQARGRWCVFTVDSRRVRIRWRPGKGYEVKMEE